MKYDQRGVSADKTDVHKAIKNLDKGLFPNAFCKILPDVVGNDANYCNIMHADTAGTKTSLAYMYWKETNDISVWKGIVQDAIVMNIDDMACVGCFTDIILSSTIGRNRNLISGDVISEIINGAEEFIQQMKSYGVGIHSAGGETADVGDIVRTIDVGYTTFARMKREDLLVNKIKPGNVIVGLASYGQASYEDAYNGGMGSNGLTSARHDVLDSSYRERFPECFDPATPIDLVFSGSKKLVDTIQVNGVDIPVGKLILSPTRTYLPVLARVFADKSLNIDGIIHCTGGAQTKVLHFVDNVKIVKNNLLPIPPLFQMIEEIAKTDRTEMYKVFNMGHRLEFYCDEDSASKLVDMSTSFGIDAQIIGHVEESNKKELIIEDNKGEYSY